MAVKINSALVAFIVVQWKGSLFKNITKFAERDKQMFYPDIKRKNIAQKREFDENAADSSGFGTLKLTNDPIESNPLQQLS